MELQFTRNLGWCISESNYIKLHIAGTLASWEKTTKKHLKRGSTSDPVFLTLKILHESYYEQVMIVYTLRYEVYYILLSQVSRSGGF